MFHSNPSSDDKTTKCEGVTIEQHSQSIEILLQDCGYHGKMQSCQRGNHPHDKQKQQKTHKPADGDDSWLFHQHQYQQQRDLDVTGNWAFNNDRNIENAVSKTIFDKSGLAPSSDSWCTESPDCCSQGEVLLHQHDLTKLIVETTNIADQTLHYLFQEEQVELCKSCDCECVDGENDTKYSFDLLHGVDSSSCASQLCKSKEHGISINEEVDLAGSDLSLDTDGNQDQLMISNISSILHTRDSSVHTIVGGNFHEEGRLCYTNIGHELIQIMGCMSVKDRRPLMSIAVEYVLKHDMELLLGEKITNYEWSKARKHRKYPGPGRIIKANQHFFRKRVKEAVVSEFVEWLHASDMLQSLSYGHKVVRYCNGYHVPVEAVKRNKTKSSIIRQYIDFWNEARVSTQELEESSCYDTDDKDDSCEEEDDYQLCSSVCRKTGAPCLKEKGHEGCHSFTPKGMLSPSTIEEILNHLTSGQIKSLIGLDNTYVESGHENFEGMKAWVKKLTDVGKVGGQTFPDGGKIIQNIANVAEFYKIGFPRHLGQDESYHICTCFQCGFYSEDDTICCKLHNQNKHLGPCKECVDSFQLFEDMFSFHKQVSTYLKEGGFYDHNPVLQDDMDSWHDEIHEHLRHLLKFRAHCTA